MRLTAGKVITALRRRGYKITPQRRAVVEVITSSRDSLTPSVIHEKLNRNHPDIGLVTIYRTLEILTGLDLVCELHAGGKCRSYTTATARHHHHLICTSCGTVVDFSGHYLEKLEKSLTRESGFRIDSHLLEFAGLCRTCQKAG
ncbi:Fur family transcriptional regulator [Chloroflexota bacterium]